MASLSLSIPHTLSEDEAVTRIKHLIRETKKTYGSMVTDTKEHWSGYTGTFSFSARGFVLSGTIEVLAKKIQIEGELPLMLGFMKGKIERVIKEQAAVLLRN